MPFDASGHVTPEEPPLSRAELAAATAARWFLYLLGVAAIALLPLGFALELYQRLQP
jgi:hypothetical protein